MPVAVVSSTVNGRAVRAVCAAYGLDGLIGAYLCSEKFCARKPAVQIVWAALRAVAAEPATSWFLGIEPANDATASAAGITHRVLGRGSSAPEAGPATAVVHTPDGLLSHRSSLCPLGMKGSS